MTTTTVAKKQAAYDIMRNLNLGAVLEDWSYIRGILDGAYPEKSLVLEHAMSGMSMLMSGLRHLTKEGFQ